MEYPFNIFERECYELLLRAMREEGLEGDISLTIPPSPNYGDLSFATFIIAKRYNRNPNELSKVISSRIMSYNRNLLEKVEAVGGYVNFFVNYGKFAKLVLDVIINLGDNYGKMEDKGIRIIVEHTSVNPIHPIHIGGARNAVIGDVLSNILKFAGYNVKRHFYINDMGLQVSQAAYGFSKLIEIGIQGKKDHFIGFIYAVTNCAINIKKLKEEIKNLKDDERIREKLKELDEWTSIAFELRSKNEKIFDIIIQAIYEDENPEEKIADLLRRYEGKEDSAIKIIRNMCELTIAGFKETLSRMGIEFDSWDWESEITTWSGSTELLINKLMRFGRIERGTYILDCNYIIERFKLEEKYGIKTEVPPLVLKRSDGTTLYTTRDIAYTIWKFQRADKVINVISLEQKLPQLQLKLALYALDLGDLADKLVHFSYELVRLPGMKMSGRRGRYVSLDEVLDEAIRRAYEEVSKSELSDEEKRSIAEAVGIGAVKYALISVAPNKPIIFTWERVLDFEKNSGPFVQYAYARASNIIVKAGNIDEKADYEKMITDYERRLIMKLALFPNIIEKSANELKPELIAEYTNDLASTFNLFYDNVPVLKADSEELRNARLKLVKAVKIVLKNSLSIMGIKAL
ncbi:MAG: arginine--tRNA ligase, partial [Candidatus Methanomethyliaceae archaeon]|nr:arginine--tRNA ligase [Candidatus Methanomethyliaceae archaeon]MDW7971561.1 arginine--tRNA ligase [Nitrososphaerota archaeon]